MDRRVMKTRMSILNAFGRLLAVKKYNKITVQEIIDEADVGRSTFYSHFETKDNLLKEICTDLFNHVFLDPLTSEPNHSFLVKADEEVDLCTLVEKNTEAIITHILYHIKDNNTNMIALFRNDSGELFLDFFKKYLNKMLAVYILEKSGRNNRVAPDGFLINHISGSFINMLQWWISRGMKESPEELSRYYSSIIEKVV